MFKVEKNLPVTKTTNKEKAMVKVRSIRCGRKTHDIRCRHLAH